MLEHDEVPKIQRTVYDAGLSMTWTEIKPKGPLPTLEHYDEDWSENAEE